MEEYILDDLVFEWDDIKAAKNFEKHGIRFTVATKVFLDKNFYEEYDADNSIDEDRFIIIGMVRKILTVVYTERGEKIRLISARRATKSEEEKYYGRFNKI